MKQLLNFGGISKKYLAIGAFSFFKVLFGPGRSNNRCEFECGWWSE
jgi:hypothetical protein